LSIKPSGFVPSKEPNLVHLDADKVQFPLTLRPVREGDWFVPFGMTGRKLVSDFLTDRKVNLLDKRKALVVCDATNAVLWLVGYRTDNRFRITDETKAVLELSLNT
jgi:tRNA(Ile)-lysidine synthase